MKRSSRLIVLCLVLQAYAAAGQQPPTPRARVTDHRWPAPRDLAPPTSPRVRSVDVVESRVTHPRPDFAVRRGPVRTLAGALAGAAFFGVGAALTFWLTREGGVAPAVRPPSPSRAPGPTLPPGVEVRRVSVAFDWTARASIQHALAAAPDGVDPGTPPGLHAAAARARDALANAHRAARAGAFQTYALEPALGQQVFGQIAGSLRGRHTVETIDAARRAVAATPRPRAEEGPRLVVVTLLVAARGPLPPLPTAMTLPGLMAALDAMIPSRADQLAALEVVWSPADEGEPMSAAELTVLFPELLRLDDSAPGRRACGSCHAIYAGELGRCAACGGV